MQRREDGPADQHGKPRGHDTVEPAVHEPAEDRLLRQRRDHADDDHREHEEVAVVVLHGLTLRVVRPREEMLAERL